MRQVWAVIHPMVAQATGQPIVIIAAVRIIMVTIQQQQIVGIQIVIVMVTTTTTTALATIPVVTVTTTAITTIMYYIRIWRGWRDQYCRLINNFQMNWVSWNVD